MNKILLTSSLLLATSCTVFATTSGKSPTDSKVAIERSSETKPDNKPVSRGRLLYQNHCTSCHESNVHIRERKKAKTLADITMWVGKWSGYRKLEWSTDEIRAVRDYLNQAYYNYSK